MTAMDTRKWVQVCGRLVAAAAILLVPVAASAADGPVVRVTRPGVGRVTLEVADGYVTVRKDMGADGSVVTMATPGDRLVLVVRRGVLSVTGPAGTMTMGGGGAVEYERVLAALEGSEAAARARALLARVAEGPETFVGQSVLLTRAILESGTGTTTALRRHQQWVSERAAARAGARETRPLGRTQVVWASVADLAQGRGPGECWDLYAAEAIRIADDFSDCTDALRWYEAHKWAGCSLIYAVRSEAAMAWFISCNGGIPFSG